MSKVLLRRMLLFLPTLLVISLLSFVISINAPGDPVDRLLPSPLTSMETVVVSKRLMEDRAAMRHQLGLDLPAFYLSVSSLSLVAEMPDFQNPEEEEAWRKMVHQSGHADLVTTLYHAFDNWMELHAALDLSVLPDSAYLLVRQSSAIVRSLRQSGNTDLILSSIDRMLDRYSEYEGLNELSDGAMNTRSAVDALGTHTARWKNLVPVVQWNRQNQYHRWLFGDGHWLTGKGAVETKGVIRGDFGRSYTTKLPVSNILRERIGWSLFFTFTSVLLAYLISLPVGLRAAAKPHSLFDRSSSVVLFLLYSMPAFWLATLLLMNFANPDVLKWFPASGVAPAGGFPAGTGWWGRITGTIPYLVLPTICYTYAQLAFLSRMTRVSTLEIYGQDFIRTARAKGLSARTVLYRHAFRNALLPIITVFANVFPAAIGGSVILETVFSIPGMGREIVQAIYQQDYPVIVAVFTLTGVLTLAGYLLADILYSIADPRITWKR